MKKRKFKTGPNDTATRYPALRGTTFTCTSDKPLFITALRLAKKALK